MAIPRAHPYIWVTWLSSMMSGDNPCQWQPWFKTNNKLEETQPSDFNLVGWKIDHTRMLTVLGDELERRDGALVRTEEELSFVFEDFGAKLVGKADCICREPGCLTVFDCKTGKERDSDKVQVMIYMWLIENNPATDNRPVRGEIVYTDKRVPIERLPENFGDNLTYFVKLLCGKKPLRTSPGGACRFCQVTGHDCEDRVD